MQAMYDELVSVEQEGRFYRLILWDVDGEPTYLGLYKSQEEAERDGRKITRIVNTWLRVASHWDVRRGLAGRLQR